MKGFDKRLENAQKGERLNSCKAKEIKMWNMWTFERLRNLNDCASNIYRFNF